LLILSGLLAVAVAMVLTFFLSRRVVAPVEALAKVAQAVARRDFSVRAEAGSRDEVGELSRTFNSMVSELSRTEELRRNLVADLAHELRTPVTNIRGYIEGLADGVMAPDGGTLDSMHGEVRLLTRLIEDLQDLALAESGQLRLSVHSCNPASLARRAVTAIQQRAQGKQIALRVDVPAELPVQVDPERISQVLRNLLVNAVEYTPAGGEVLLLALEGGPEVRLAVRDTGPGIPAEDLPYAFERFYRVDKSRSRATGGLGLGLTIARRLVEAHGGDIEVHSEPGEGTEFVVRLPRNENGPSAKV
jgi:two-component system sensor histidine kinase BaeS